MATGATQPLDSAQASYRSLSWTEKGDALATLRGADDKAFEDKLYTLVAFKDFARYRPRLQNRLRSQIRFQLSRRNDHQPQLAPRSGAKISPK